jgi:hypothetical protein
MRLGMGSGLQGGAGRLFVEERLDAGRLAAAARIRAVFSS